MLRGYGGKKNYFCEQDFFEDEPERYFFSAAPHSVPHKNRLKFAKNRENKSNGEINSSNHQ